MKWLSVVGLLFFVPNVQAAVVYSEGFETGAVKIKGTATCFERDTHFRIQSNIVRNGKYAVYLTKPANKGKRCEIIPRRSFKDIADFYWGKEYWAGFSFYIPSGMTNNGYGIIHQHHSSWPGERNSQPKNCKNTSDTSLPPTSGGNGFTIRRGSDPKFLNIRLTPSRELNKPSGRPASANTEIAYSFPLVKDKWYDVVMNFKYSDKSDGFWKIWIDGKQVVNRTGSNVNLHTNCEGVLKKKAYYQAFGIYTGTAGAGAIIYDEVKNGDANSSYKEIAPGGKGTTSGFIPVSSTPYPPSPRSQASPNEPLTIPENLKLEIK